MKVGVAFADTGSIVIRDEPVYAYPLKLYQAG